MSTERIVALAKQLLTIPISDDRRELWLWEHAERVMHLAQSIAALPEVIGRRQPDRLALTAAALFHDAGWVAEFQQGRYRTPQLLARPTSDIQRELGAAMLLEDAAHLLPAASLRLAADAIRLCNDRNADLLEARVLSEAEALDEIGVLYVLRQYRQYQDEGRPLAQLVQSWERQQEFSYWDVRINAGFRYDTTRALARQRLEAVAHFMLALKQCLRGDDVRQLLEIVGANSDPTP